MKTTKTTFWFICISLAILLGCSDDDKPLVVDSSPLFESLQEQISSLPGLTFTFKAVVTDPAGINAVNIKYEEWFLDKTIIKNDNPESYEINYQFKVPEDAIANSTHIIPIKIINAGGNETTQNVEVTLNQDVSSPQIDAISPANESTVLIGNAIEFNINVTDNNLSEFKIESDVLNETLPISGTDYNYINAINIEEPGTYTFDITVTDTSGNSSSETVSVNVAEELNFLTMFITDSNAPDFADSYFAGLPIAGTGSTEPEEEGFVFSFRHYAATDNAEVYFIPQPASFDPFAFGRDPSEDGKLVLASMEDILPIILPNIGYYDINIDLRNLSYTVSAIATPEDPMNNVGFDGVFVTGSGISVDGQDITEFNPATSAPMQMDPNNPQRYSATIEFIGTNVSFIFIGNQASYSVFWRVNNGPITTTTAIVPQGGVECTSDIQYSGSYKLTVDVFLNTFTIETL